MLGDADLANKNKKFVENEEIGEMLWEINTSGLVLALSFGPDDSQVEGSLSDEFVEKVLSESS